MSYLYVFVRVEFFWNWLCYEFFHDMIFLWLTDYFAFLLKNFISAAVILDLSCFFSDHISLPHSGVSIARALYICNLVCF
jgi:hypothetical protein